MIGNDIVDLAIAAVESNWQRRGFLDKIFTVAERFLIHSAKDAELMVWLMWTMKESAYKAATDQSKIKSFAPFAFSCNNLIWHNHSAVGNVIYQGEIYFCQSTLTQRYIHTIAATSPALLSGAKLNIAQYDESDRSYRASNPVSVSHHGAFLALIYL